MLGSQIHLVPYDWLSGDFIHYCDERICMYADRVCERMSLCVAWVWAPGKVAASFGVISSQYWMFQYVRRIIWGRKGKRHASLFPHTIECVHKGLICCCITSTMDICTMFLFRCAMPIRDNNEKLRLHLRLIPFHFYLFYLYPEICIFF